ncbi:AraC family transcriptional regulator [Vallitalea longa]|uniref:AraC family transcriptional regulator n=1 Tax=Vallitalea longa TaxID=2936439 RepID=A0A9W5Y9D2_9FIRM|nr:GyrI-like domain-containing protein [Vallitalea longa]GKX29677.1 AraC family transcriptional regulator [Vallitalea longa]
MELIYNKSRLTYISNINKVQDYIEKNLEEDLTIDELARIASFSRFHFQRIYKQMTGESLYSYIKRLRLERAAFILDTNKNRSIQDISLSLGYANQASFAKAFKNTYGVSASSYRNSNKSYRDTIHRNSNINYNNTNNSTNGKVYDNIISYNRPIKLSVQIIDPIEAIYTRHTGSYAGDSELFEQLFNKLYSYVVSHNYLEKDSQWFAVYHDFGELTSEDKLRMSVCMSINKNIRTCDEFGSMILEGGKYAVGKFFIKPDEYQLAWNYMLSKWLPESSYVPDDRLSFEYYPPENNENSQERLVDIFIPIAPL